jgi:8-oxo-dGTP diphosphatase
VLAVIKDDQDRILMLKNAKHGGKRQCPGGKIDAGETAQEALTREVKEELGVECKIVQHLFDNPAFTGALWQGEYYEVTLNGKPSVQEPHKHTALERIQFVETDTDLGWITQTESETIDDEALLRQTYDFTALQTKTPFSKVYALAWTTTPWTIPTNIALGVNEELMYAMVLYE